MPPKIPGINFDFGGGRSYLLPPLTLGSLQVLQDRIISFQSVDALAPESIDTVIDVAYAALKRNYPEMTREEVGDLIDLGNMMDVVSAAMDVSGVKRKSIEVDLKNQSVQPAQTDPAGPH